MYRWLLDLGDYLWLKYNPRLSAPASPQLLQASHPQSWGTGHDSPVQQVFTEGQLCALVAAGTCFYPQTQDEPFYCEPEAGGDCLMENSLPPLGWGLFTTDRGE